MLNIIFENKRNYEVSIVCPLIATFYETYLLTRVSTKPIYDPAYLKSSKNGNKKHLRIVSSKYIIKILWRFQKNSSFFLQILLKYYRGMIF
jgi:hypothetical protein